MKKSKHQVRLAKEEKKRLERLKKERDRLLNSTISGRSRSSNISKKKKVYRPEKVFRRSDSQNIPSFVSCSSIAGTKKENMSYSGSTVIGISTLHKSNAVPIVSKEEAKEHASMRR